MILTNEAIERYLLEITPVIWSVTCHLNVSPCASGDSFPDTANTLGACVHISGAWEGVVILQGSGALATSAAETMLHIPREKATPEDMHDVMGELANITGGNLKAALPSPSHLSLPIVAQGDELIMRVPKSRRIVRLAFECEGAPLVVTVLVKESETHG